MFPETSSPSAHPRRKKKDSAYFQQKLHRTEFLFFLGIASLQKNYCPFDRQPMKLHELGRCARHAKCIFSVGPGAPFSKRHVCGVPSFSRGRDNLQPRPPAAAQPKFGSKNLRFFLPSPESLFDRCMCATTHEKHTGHLFSTNFAKKGHFVVLEVFVQKLAKLGRVAGHVAACRWARRWACRNMSWCASLGMSQHVAACHSTFGICLGMSQHVVPLFGRVATFRWGLGDFLAKNFVLGLASAPPCFSDRPRAHKRPEVSVFFCQKGIGRKEGIPHSNES